MCQIQVLTLFLPLLLCTTRYGVTPSMVAGGVARAAFAQTLDATNCRVTAANTEMECDTTPLNKHVPATDLHWMVAVSRRLGSAASVMAYSAISVDTTQYRAPNITSVVSVPTSTFTTQGGAALTIRGHNFGSYTGTGSVNGFSVVGLSRVAYGPSLSSPSVPLFEAVSCTSKALGLGLGLGLGRLLYVELRTV